MHVVPGSQDFALIASRSVGDPGEATGRAISPTNKFLCRLKDNGKRGWEMS